jgi:hypothetical protein
MRNVTTMSTAQCLKEIRKHFAAPVLTSESRENFYSIMVRYIEIIKPRDFIELMFVNDLTQATWEEMRYSTHKAMVIEREYQRHHEKEVEHHRQQLGKLKQSRMCTLDEIAMTVKELREAKKAKKAQKAKEAKEVKDAKEAKPVLGEKAKATAAERKTDRIKHLEQEWTTLSDRVNRLEAEIEEKSAEVKKILDEVPDEADHAKALQSGIAYFERFARLHADAIAWRNDVLAQIGFYREGLGPLLRRATDEIIDGDFKTSHEAALISGADDDERRGSGGTIHGELKESSHETPSIASPGDDERRISGDTIEGALKEANHETPLIASLGDDENGVSGDTIEIKEPNPEATSTAGPGGDAQ